MWCLWGCGEGWLMVGGFCVVLWGGGAGQIGGCHLYAHSRPAILSLAPRGNIRFHYPVKSDISTAMS